MKSNVKLYSLKSGIRVSPQKARFIKAENKVFKVTDEPCKTDDGTFTDFSSLDAGWRSISIFYLYKGQQYFEVHIIMPEPSKDLPNCRCVIQPVIKPDKRRRKLKQWITRNDIRTTV